MAIRAIDHVQLAMPPGGEAAARAFYGGLLGLREVAKPAVLADRGGCWFAAGGAQVHLGVEPGFQPARKAHPALRVHDLAALTARLAAAGHAARQDVALPGLARAFVDDPFGNRIELVEPDAAAPDPALLPYRAMAHNNAWANHRLLSACAALSAAEFAAPRTGFFPSLRRTLNHILTVDAFYVDAMEGGRLGPAAWADPEPCGSVAALQAAQAALDRRLIAVVAGLAGAADLRRIVAVHRGVRTQHERLDRLLLHLFQHQIHHRGQAHAMLAGTALRPPQLDEFFSVNEAPLRAAEFAALGWTEATIWGDLPPG
jgi:uncharacterized damage-inducible protein DinB/catechol 2,3-dioxygenase-like lactoylglutathione lyase family enzyme